MSACMTNKKKSGAKNRTICTKASDEDIRDLKRLALRRKQTVSKTINDLVSVGLSAIRKPKGSEQGVVPRGEQRVNPSEK